MLTTLVAWSLLVSFLVLQRVMRRGEQARSLRAPPADRGSTRLLGAAFGLGLLALAVAPALNAYGVADMDLGPAVGWVGVAVMVGGLAVRLWSQAVLGRYYTSTLRHAADQPVLASGPYRLLRHPGYGGMLLGWLGAGLATANWAAALAIALLIVVAYSYRIAAEEAMLLGAFGDRYKEYMTRTWRLVPYVY
jgi:protein-S-isoprenylcysteine O-methyltransferase Ste14